MGAGDDLWVRAAHIHIPLPLNNVAAIALQPLDYAKDNTMLMLIMCKHISVEQEY